MLSAMEYILDFHFTWQLYIGKAVENNISVFEFEMEEYTSILFVSFFPLLKSSIKHEHIPKKVERICVCLRLVVDSKPFFFLKLSKINSKSEKKNLQYMKKSTLIQFQSIWHKFTVEMNSNSFRCGLDSGTRDSKI